MDGVITRPVTEDDRDIPNAPIVIPPHALFAGSGGSDRRPVRQPRGGKHGGDRTPASRAGRIPER